MTDFAPVASTLTLTRWPTLLASCLLLLAHLPTQGRCMTDDTTTQLRRDTRNLFYHGYTNYLTHAFPEDELAPLTCKPQTRNRDNPADIGLNDVLGNYSLTLIDSLSTLAILASGDQREFRDGHDALVDFQDGVRMLVDLYGNGTEEICGSRACAFDLDSKVQVFETNIRGVGGLLSAHLFAIGELPITGYTASKISREDGTHGIQWPNNFIYHDQLLWLAYDLAKRLLPAFSTQTDLPYPRVNLHHGIPFYQDAEGGFCRLDGTSSDPREITETCAAGAGSLVLEFTTLSRLTGDRRFEDLAKKAFWAVWQRRSSIDLVGAGIDAESGQWTMPPLSGVGAGIDSFFEYAVKSSILLSTDSDADDYLAVWNTAHDAVTRHVLRSAETEKHPYYGQADLVSGAPRFSWIDNLSAYYPGLLVLSGDLEEAMESHLLFSALWTRYSALPERWHVPTGTIDPNFKHWAGRPEFVESTYHLYQATKDPWYLSVGEMVLRDIRRRCWTKCGWADLGDVVSGKLRNRMESFFLGETAKYLYLLFEKEHPLNRLGSEWVFTTEGHPLVIPKKFKGPAAKRKTEDDVPVPPQSCPAPPRSLPLTVSHIAARGDYFHAAALAQLHLVPINPARSSPLYSASITDGPGISLQDIRSPTNYTYYPWTLPQNLIPTHGVSSPMAGAVVSTLTFPNLNAAAAGSDEKPAMIALGALQKVLEGVLINSLSNMKLSMVQEPKSVFGMEVGKEFRVSGIANWALGKDEKVLVSQEAVKAVSPADPHFTRVRDLEIVDLVLDVPSLPSGPDETLGFEEGEARATSVDDFEDEILGEWDPEIGGNGTFDVLWEDIESMIKGLLRGGDSSEAIDKGEYAWNDGSTGNVESNIESKTIGRAKTSTSTVATLTRKIIPAILPTGAGAAPLPASMDDVDHLMTKIGDLPFPTIYFLDDTLCTRTLPIDIAKTHTILIIKRGDCSFNEKLANLPVFVPTEHSLQLVIFLSIHEAIDPALAYRENLVRPLLDETQKTPNGLERRDPIAMCMVDGTEETISAFRRMASSVASFDAKGRLVEMRRGEGEGDGSAHAGLGVKRRYWFESMGVPIGNLIML